MVIFSIIYKRKGDYMSWWNNYEDEFIEMVAYYESILKRSEELEKFFSDYKKETMYRLVFESNTIENEGLKINETKKLSLGIDYELNNNLKDIFNNFRNEAKLSYQSNDGFLILINNSVTELTEHSENFENYANLIFQEVEKYLSKKMLEHFKNEKLVFLKDNLSGKININYQDSMKEFQITFNQIFLLTVNNSFTDLILLLVKNIKEFLKRIDINLLDYLLKEHVFKGEDIDIKDVKSFIENLTKLSDENLRGVACSFLSSGEYLKMLHELVANKLDNNDNGNPGEYRNEAAFIDLDTTFLQPNLIESAMKNLANSSFDRALHENYNFILEACKNSALFIKIHPFGDFNGRISRLLLNNFYIMNKLPFFIVLRSDSKDKKKYIESMRRYYESKKIDKFLSLICKTFKKHIDEINDSLDLAGLDIIEKTELSEEKINQLKKSLKFYGL